MLGGRELRGHGAAKPVRLSAEALLEVVWGGAGERGAGERGDDVGGDGVGGDGGAEVARLRREEGLGLGELDGGTCAEAKECISAGRGGEQSRASAAR
jgi:hypothetical protein